jgi:uncharacterized membrane protein YeaQ/YmgE (transglycosylase-associated protein family)
MGLIVAILLGALVGFFAQKMTGRDSGFWVSAGIGIVGAFLGNVVSYVIGGGKQAFLTFDLSGLLWSLGGAVLFCFILNAIQKRRAL